MSQSFSPNTTCISNLTPHPPYYSRALVCIRLKASLDSRRVRLYKRKTLYNSVGVALSRFWCVVAPRGAERETPIAWPIGSNRVGAAAGMGVRRTAWRRWRGRARARASSLEAPGAPRPVLCCVALPLRQLCRRWPLRVVCSVVCGSVGLRN